MEKLLATVTKQRDGNTQQFKLLATVTNECDGNTQQFKLLATVNQTNVMEIHNSSNCWLL